MEAQFLFYFYSYCCFNVRKFFFRGTSFYWKSILKFFSMRSVRREMQPQMITLTMNVEISFMKLLPNTYQIQCISHTSLWVFYLPSMFVRPTILSFLPLSWYSTSKTITNVKYYEKTQFNTFECNAKRFSIAFLFLFLLLLLVSVFRRTDGQCFWHFSPIAALSTCDQDRSY